MPVTIDQVTAQQFARTVLLLSQQKGSKLASRVRNESVSSAELAYFDTLAMDEDTAQKTGRHQGTPITEPNFGRRKVTPVPWTNNKGLDKEDLDRMIPDPTNIVAQNQGYSLGRKKDDVIIAAALGTAYIGKTGATSTTLAAESIGLNSDGSVTTLGTAPAYTGASSVSITLAKMLKMMYLFNSSDVDPDIAKYWSISPMCVEYMLSLTVVGSYDYNTVKAIQAGRVEQFAGFQWMWSNRLLNLVDTNDHWRTFAWAEDGIVLATIGDISTRIDERKDLDYMWQIFSKMDLGAVRMEGAKVHECLSYKTPTISGLT
jgi:hypothetical protein